MSNTPIKISVGDSRWATQWIRCSIPWEDFADDLRNAMQNNCGTETHAKYMALPKAKRDGLKDVGGFVGGTLRDSHRRRGCCTGRSLITLDLDNCEPGSTAKWVQAIKDMGTAAVYSTRKHDSEHPRLRAIFPTDRVMQPEEYQPVARMVAQILDPTMKVLDPTTFEAERLMYWPSRSADSQWVCGATPDGQRIVVDDILWLYEDWHDVRQWPACPSETAIKTPGSKQADPTTKPGVVGAFCRTYDIRAAISKFLPGVYEDAGQDRLTYAAGSTTAGAVLYDNDTFIYSHHSTDPAGGKLLNAWDLVRIHKFGDLDAEVAPGTPPASLPSWAQMRILAESDAPTAALLRQETVDHATEGFEPLPDEDTDPDKWQEKLDRTQKGALCCTIQNAWVILENDPVLKGRIWSDTFAERLRCKGPFPWTDKDQERDWSDEDDAGVRWYLETAYHFSGVSKAADAVALTGGRHARDPVREYLNGLHWDGTERLDTLFIDFLGAEDTPYSRAVTRKMFVAAVARCFRPGCKFDQICILSGKQGIGKSLLLSRMGRDWFNDSITSFDGKEARENLRGVWIVELGEMTAFSRSESEAAKQFLSQTEDRYRAAYGRRTAQYPRRCVFFGTSNGQDFLRDTTGNRRYWPIDCSFERRKKIVHDDLTPEMVDQLWAEAVIRYQQGEELILRDELQAAAIAEQQAHTERDPWEGTIIDFLEKPVPLDWAKRTTDERICWWENGPAEATETTQRTSVCVNELWRECLDNTGKAPDRQQSKRIAAVLNGLPGWTQGKYPQRCGPYGAENPSNYHKLQACRNPFDEHTEHTSKVGIQSIQRFPQTSRELKKSRVRKQAAAYKAYKQHTEYEKFVCTKNQVFMRFYQVKHTEHTIFSPGRSESEEKKKCAHTHESLIFFTRGNIGGLVVFVCLYARPKFERRNYHGKQTPGKEHRERPAAGC